MAKFIVVAVAFWVLTIISPDSPRAASVEVVATCESDKITLMSDGSIVPLTVEFAESSRFSACPNWCGQLCKAKFGSKWYIYFEYSKLAEQDEPENETYCIAREIVGHWKFYPGAWELGAIPFENPKDSEMPFIEFRLAFDLTGFPLAIPDQVIENINGTKHRLYLPGDNSTGKLEYPWRSPTEALPFHPDEFCDQPGNECRRYDEECKVNYGALLTATRDMANNWSSVDAVAHVEGAADGNTLPSSVMNSDDEFFEPIIGAQTMAEGCLSQSKDEESFADCFIRNGMVEEQTRVYDCIRSQEDLLRQAYCVAEPSLPEEIKTGVSDGISCMEDHDYTADPIAAATECVVDAQDEHNAKFIRCVKSDYDKSNGHPSFWGTAFCMNRDHLDLTTEQAIVIECALYNNKSVMEFAGCAGGKLTKMELQKCWNQGVGGGDGCFGQNNEIIKAWNTAINDISNGIGGNNDLRAVVRTIDNDLKNGLGSSNEVKKGLKTIANDVTKGPGENNDARKFFKNAVPHISVPSL